MVRIDAAQIVNVKRNAGIVGKRQEEFSRQLSIKLADHRGSKIDSFCSLPKVYLSNLYTRKLVSYEYNTSFLT